MKILIALSVSLLLTVDKVFCQIPEVTSGKIVRLENFASQYVQPRNIDIWLPEGYDPSQKYFVLYMNDGQMLFDSTTTWNRQEWGVDETMSRLMRKRKIKDCIVVGIWNSGPGRHSEYFPQKPFETLSSTEKETVYHSVRSNGADVFQGQKIQSDNYLKFIVSELKPFIDKNYATLPGRENTFIAGSSMGGLISMYAVCEYPGIFGGAACLSTHWPGIFSIENNPVPSAFMDYLQSHLPDPANHKFYFDYGTETLDALYKPYQQQADRILKAHGYTSNNWMTKEFRGENHSEKAWQKRLHIPLVFLLGR